MHHTLLNQMKYLHHRRNNESNISFNDCHHNLQLNDINFSNEYTINIDKWWILKKYQLIFCISQYSGIIEIRILNFSLHLPLFKMSLHLYACFFLLFFQSDWLLLDAFWILYVETSKARMFEIKKKWTNCERINI